MATVGENIKKLRTKLGMNQEEFGELLDVQKGTVSAWENNRLVPSYARLETMAKLGKTKVSAICPKYSKEMYTKNPYNTGEFTRRYGQENKRAFFEALACIKALSLGYGEIRNGFTVPKRGKSVEFNAIVFDTLKQNNAF